MRAQAALDVMDIRVFSAFAEDVEIDHVEGGVSECQMVIDRDYEPMTLGHDAVKQTMKAVVLGSLRLSDAACVKNGDMVTILADDECLNRYRVGVSFPVRDGIVTMEMHEEALA